MKKPKWYAKALYIAFALALAIGLTAPAAFAGEGTIDVTGPDYGKVGQNVTFTATCTPGADQVVWSGGGTPAGKTDTAKPIATSTFTTMWSTPGPHTVSATGSWGTINQTDTKVITLGEGLMPQVEHNIIGSEATFEVPGVYVNNVTCWEFLDTWYGGSGSYAIVSGGTPECPTIGAGDPSVTVQSGSWGELVIVARTNLDYNTDTPGDDVLYAIKKWGKIDDTMLSDEGVTQVVWNENCKKFEGNATLTETVIGTFKTDGGITFHEPAQGAFVTWWVMDARAPVDTLEPKVYLDLAADIDAMQAMYPAMLVGFGTCDVKVTNTVSGVDGTSTVVLQACGEEAVKVVCVAHYPFPVHDEQWPVFPETTSWNFWTQELEKVPQVRWAGEKIVLEKQFGSNYAGMDVCFTLENDSPGTLEVIVPDGTRPPSGQSQDTVWMTVDCDGIARCIAHTQEQGKMMVLASLYDADEPWQVINQHGFIVYWLKVEGITLGNVNGTRVDHNAGLWTPPNPWDPSSDVTAETLNVSEDTLLRVRVKGFFEMKDKSMRPEEWCDVNGNGVQDMYDYWLPAGRWVLPDDWQYLAGPEWEQNRPHWDIMDQPNDDIVAESELGPYFDALANTIANSPVIGPYSSLDIYAAALSPVLDRKTIVRNGKLNWWDAPMPPAKIELKIQDAADADIAGFFKDTDKGEVYYLAGDPMVFTNPFYAIKIPASEFIVPFVNNGGYDWDSWNWTYDYGDYNFWKIINQPPGATPSNDDHPTKVEVYSDNHGEAMVYLNGDWNLDWDGLDEAWGTVGIDIPPATVVGNTTVVAGAEYPYFRGEHPKVLSLNVTKTWTWGKEVRGADDHGVLAGTPYKDGSYDPFDTRIVYDVVATNSQTKIAWIFVCDRDGFPAEGEMITWELDSAFNQGTILDLPPDNYDIGLPNQVWMEHGFLEGTNGMVTNPTENTRGVSYARATEGLGDPALDVWADKYGTEPCHHAVAAIILDSSQYDEADLTVYLDEGPQIRTIKRSTEIMFETPENFVTAPGDANGDGNVNMGDVTKTERIILALDAPTPGADANQDTLINMADVTQTEIIILGA